MKVKYYEVSESYEDLEETLKYTVEVLGMVQEAIQYYVGLNSFTGAAADSLKGYLADVHLNIAVTLQVIVSDLLVKVGGGIEGYLDSVDSKKSSVISTDHIMSVISGFSDVSVDFKAINRNINSILDEVNDIFSSGVSYNDTAGKLTKGIETCNTEMNKVKKSLTTYNKDHRSDCSDIMSTLDQVKKLIQNAKAVLSKGKIDYDGSDQAYQDVLSKMKTYNEKEFEELYNKPDNLPEDVMSKLGNALQVYGFGTWCDTAGITMADAKKLAQYGVELEYAEGMLKITSKTKTAEEIKDVLKSFGFKHMTNSKMNKLLGKGLAMEKFKNSKLVSEMAETKGFRWGGVKEAGNGLDDVSKLSKAGKVLNVVGTGVTVVANGYGNMYDPETGKWTVNAETVTDTVTDTAVDVAMDAAIQKGCAAIGTAACPVIGTAIGYAVGTAVSYLSSNYKFGTPPKSVNDRVKDVVSDVTHGIGNCLSKLFW